MEGRVLLSSYTLNTLAYCGSNASGSTPVSPLIADSSGNLYGTTSAGGQYGLGTVFEIASGSSATTTLASFNGITEYPDGSLVTDASGNLYGTTWTSTSPNGSIFELAKGSNAFTVLATFPSDYTPIGLAMDSSGDLYGATSSFYNDGTVFELAKGSNQIATLASFNGTNGDDPRQVVLDAKGDIFGSTSYGGTDNDGVVFEISKGSGAITDVASFSDLPGQIVLDGSGDILGATWYGGYNNAGTLFEIATGSTTVTTLAQFGNDASKPQGPVGPIVLDASGNLYGTTQSGGSNGEGTVFELVKGSNVTTSLASFNDNDGFGQSFTSATLMMDGAGDLYGTTNVGGANGGGMVFKIAAGSQAMLPVVQFDAISGSPPTGTVAVDSSGNVFGTTSQGGSANDGTVCEVANGSNLVTTIASFTGANGSDPLGGLTQDAAGNFYGTTDTSTGSDGSVFEIAKGSASITTLAFFNGTDGSGPDGGVTVDSAGNVYGTTSSGGANNAGGVFEIASGSNAITNLVSFTSYGERSQLAVDSAGDLYGILTRTGTATAYEIAPGTGTMTTLAAFNSESAPGNSVALDASGNLYGTTTADGVGGCGIVFEVSRGSGKETTLATFDGSGDGSGPAGGVTIDPSGDLFGTTVQGGPVNGTVFELPQGSTTISTLASFNGTDGSSPKAGIALVGSTLYGTTSSGGPANLGTVFNLTVHPTVTSVTLTETTGPNPSYTNQALVFSATVSSGVPNGETVTLIDTSINNAVVATGALTNGTTTLTIPADTLSVGGHWLRAVYGGDANFYGSESDSYLQTVLVNEVTGISPSSGPATGGTTVTITGNGFNGATAVEFGSKPATSFTVNTAGTQITAVDPPETSATAVYVTVVTPGGTSPISEADQFLYTLPSWVSPASGATYNGSTHALTVTGATTIIADPGSDEPNIVASGATAKLTIAPTASPLDIHIGGITLTEKASIVMSDVDASHVADGTNASNHHTDHNVLVIGSLGAVNDPTISIDSASKLDLGDNDLIVHTGSSDAGTDDVQGFPETNELKAVEALAATGRNVAAGGIYNGTWTGNGLTSSAAATADDSANAGYEQNILAVEQNSDMYLGGYTKWTVGSASETLGANDIIVKYTYNGDLNLDGAVDGNASTIFSTFYDNGATSGNTYAYGDLNGDGKINGNDATIFSTVYGNGLAGSGLPQL